MALYGIQVNLTNQKFLSTYPHTLSMKTLDNVQDVHLLLSFSFLEVGLEDN